jgi:hypothetical protein
VDPIGALLARIQQIPWFATIGRAERRESCLPALLGYLARCGGGRPQVHWASGWAEAKEVVRALDDATALWLEEERWRVCAVQAAHSAQRDEVLAGALHRLSEIGYGAVRPDVADEELARVASGAALWTAAEALTWATAADLLAPQENPFLPKLRIFELGHWPLGFWRDAFVIL